MQTIKAGSTVVPGAFYMSRQPGGWADGATRIHIPGPIVVVNKVTRKVEAIDSMPNPVQLPTHKISYLTENTKERGEVDFDRSDAEGTCEGLNLALQTGNIELVPDETVRELFPKAWKGRKNKIVHYGSQGVESKDLGELFDDFLSMRKVRLQSGTSPEAQDREKEEERARDRQRRIEQTLENAVPGVVSENAVAPGTAPVPPQPPIPPQPEG